ncbi:zinc finger protein ZFP2-like isoform X2 [Ornithodoros turicata]|uniref:zinc finger protein ZFP2-like isoform X2 n=1 Tax=Ornithodoros turicata TaxID=34597 RepID=UPI003139C5DE
MDVTNEDFIGVQRAACKKCACTSYRRLTDISRYTAQVLPGTCVQCWHSPVDHVQEEIYSHTTGTPACSPQKSQNGTQLRQSSLAIRLVTGSTLQLPQRENSSTKQMCPSQQSSSLHLARDNGPAEDSSHHMLRAHLCQQPGAGLEGPGPSSRQDISSSGDFILSGGEMHTALHHGEAAALPSCTSGDACITPSNADGHAQDSSGDHLAPAASGTSLRTKGSNAWPHGLPQFSPGLQLLLRGQEQQEERSKLIRQLKDELIIFLDKNELITSGTKGHKRWQYAALGREIAHAYPSMVFETGKCGTRAFKQAAQEWSVFMRRTSKARTARKARKKSRTSSVVPQASRKQTTFTLEEALAELKGTRAASSSFCVTEDARDTCVSESSRSSPSDSQLQEMQLSTEFGDDLVRVKSEPPDVACLPEESQVQQQHCGQSPSGGVTPGACGIKEEPQEDLSNEEPITEVKTEPYNVAILAGHDQTGHSWHSESEDSTASTDMEHTDTCNPASSDSLKRPFAMEDKVGEKMHESDLSPTAFSLSESAKNHMHKNTHEMHYKCDLCPAAFSHSTHMHCHKRIHTDVRPHKCDLCPAEFTRLHHLDDHIRTHTGDKPFKCDLCPAAFRHSTHLQRHKRTHTGEKPYKCKLCPAVFSHNTNLQRHNRTHTGEKPYKCDLCPSEFAQLHHLKDHIRIHTGEKPFKCDLCPAAFSHSMHLQRHKRTHTGDKPYKCKLCPAAFSHSTSLKCHNRTHTGEKPYKCDLCPAVFSHNTNLQRHNRTHTGEKPYKCDLCPSEFAQLHHLKDHTRIHTGEKPFKCDLCPAAFSHSMHLQRHKRTHTGDKPYKCKLCPAVFSHSTSLKCHNRTHTGERPYKCDLCPAAFSNSTNLQRHNRTHTASQEDTHR